MTEESSKLAVFEGRKVRRTWHNNEWYFSVVDIVGILTDSSIPKRYWSDLKARIEDEGFEPYDKIVQLKLPADDGKLRLTDCVNTQNAFRIIQSIPSKKAEPFKQWLAKVGYERVQEIEDPELAQKRMIAIQISSKNIISISNTFLFISSVISFSFLNSAGMPRYFETDMVKQSEREIARSHLYFPAMICISLPSITSTPSKINYQSVINS